MQQRLTTPDRLGEWLRRMEPLRRAPEFRALLADIRGGAHALSEVDPRHACREVGVALPRGQTAPTTPTCCSRPRRSRGTES